MPIRLGDLNVSAAVVGSSYTLSWQTFTNDMGVYLPTTPEQDHSKLFIWNESGCGFNVDTGSGHMYSTYLPAGAWRAIHVPLDVSALKLTVSELVTGGQLSVVKSVYYGPNENVEADIGLLGNSPAGIGGLAGGQQVRVVAVPIAPLPLLSKGQALTAAEDINLRTDGFAGGLMTGGVQVCGMYLYWFKFRLDPLAAALATADVTLWGDLMNGASVVSSVALHHAYAAAGLPTGTAIVVPDDFTPAEALQNGVSSFSLPVTGVRWRLHVNAIGGAPVARWSIGVGVDIINAIGPGTHGNFTPNVGVF